MQQWWKIMLLVSRHQLWWENLIGSWYLSCTVCYDYGNVLELDACSCGQFPSVWLVLILGVSAPRMTISNRMYYLNSVMHSRLYNNRGAGCPRPFMCKWTPGLPRIFTEVRSLFHVPSSSLWPVLRAGHISRMRYACPPRVQRPQTGKDHIVLNSLCKFIRIW